jgi:hypothetical protein
MGIGIGGNRTIGISEILPNQRRWYLNLYIALLVTTLILSNMARQRRVNNAINAAIPSALDTASF